jgi:hypothetical protein
MTWWMALTVAFSWIVGGYLLFKISRINRPTPIPPSIHPDIQTYIVELRDGCIMQVDSNQDIGNFIIIPEGDSLHFLVNGVTQAIIPETHVEMVYIAHTKITYQTANFRRIKSEQI